jgi:hypothetical protein
MEEVFVGKVRRPRPYKTAEYSKSAVLGNTT